ncbi:MAG TPA: hypothetical protein DCZ63_15160 [Geobacter sp.]|nr:hypothetical protein [Geobacter sp.]
MTKSELLAAARIALGDTVVPYLWSDAELTSHIQDAEQEAAERANLIKVSGVEAYCTIAILANTASYSTHALVYEIEKARITGEQSALKRTSREKLDFHDVAWEDETGLPREYFLEGNTITLYPKPTENATLNLVVLRLPVTPMGTSPEIHARHHVRMLDWAYRQAFLKKDADTYSESESMKYERMFAASFGQRWDANMQTRRTRRTATHMKDTAGGDAW